MKRIFTLAALVILSVCAMANPVDLKTARIAGTHHLQREGLIKANDTLSLALTKQHIASGKPITTYYIFNFQDRGFVIVSADDRCTPILGYSANGLFQPELMPVNMMSWIEEYSEDIAQGILEDYPENKEMQQEWNELINGKFTFPTVTKADDYLVQSTWEQGYGYNKYCPQFNGNRAVVGCVATAMSQIIRYWGAPTRGFGRKSYTHSYYGQLSVDFDTTEYDYSLMPDHVNYWADDNVIDMVSRLCYHCGLVVNMNYENPTYTEGSGAQTSKVVDGLMHFGYTEAQCYTRTQVNDDTKWINMIRHEIDNRRPIEYSGHSESYGHAFVLDGYKANNNKYHFNWGWGGYSDGFYTLTTMQGFVNNQQMIINIFPSGLDGHAERFYLSPDGQGNGTSWDQTSNNLQAAIAINTLSTRDIWMKEGTYYGHTSADYAYTFTGAATIVGGFEGTEEAANERTPELHPTIIDGQNTRGLMNVGNTSPAKSLKISDIVLTNGYSPNGYCVQLRGNTTVNFITINNCHSDSGSVLRLNDALLRGATIQGNTAPVICQVNDGAIRQSLISNNDAEIVVNMNQSGSRIVNTNIVSNQGIGVKFNVNRSSFVNNIIWNNDTSMVGISNLNDTSIRNCAIECDTDFVDSTWVRLSNGNDQVRFINPSNRGVAGMAEETNWRLNRGSVCIDKGVKICTTDGDLDRAIRCRNSIIDLGCYESNYPVSINNVEHSTFSIYPNPAINTVTIEGLDCKEATIYDINGRPVMQINTNRADISNLSKGVYYLRSQGRTTKFIKQ